MECEHDFQYTDEDFDRNVDVLLIPVKCDLCGKEAYEAWSGYVYIDQEGNEL